MPNSEHLQNVERMASLLKSTLRRVVVGDPLKTLFRPSMELHIDQEANVALRIQLHSVNADTGHAFMVPSTHPLAYYQLSIYARDPKRFVLFVHQALLAAMKHEVDESVRYDGEYVVVPTHWGPRSTEPPGRQLRLRPHLLLDAVRGDMLNNEKERATPVVPTGSLTIVQSFMDDARKADELCANMVKFEAWNTAIQQSLTAENRRVQAGLEFLLWLLARMQMPDEPTYEELKKVADERKGRTPTDGGSGNDAAG